MASANVVLSELLAYVNTYRGRATDFNIRLAILRWYNIEEITTARSTMEAGVKNVIPNYPHFGKKRTDSANRSAREVMVSDIIEMFKCLDGVDEKENIPSFAAIDVSKLPPASPEAAADMMSVMETLAAQQRQLAQLQETMVSLRADVNANKAEIRERESRPNRGNSVTGQPQQRGADSVPASSSNVPEPTAADDRDAADDRVATSGVAIVNGASTSGQTSETRGPREPKGNIQHTTFADALNRVSNKSEFQSGAKRPNKGINKGAGGKKVPTPKICGTKQCGNLKAGPNTIQVQLTNVNSNTSADDIEKFINDTEENISAVKVEDLSAVGWDTKRYIVTFNYEHLQTVVSPDFWPKGIYIKRWFPAKKQQQNAEATRI